MNGKASLEILYRYTTPEAILATNREELIGVIGAVSGKGRPMAEQKYASLFMPPWKPPLSATGTAATIFSFAIMSR